ncbi:hypothetical protein PVAP13_7KG274455 [Panicum virgatum]|uniref:Uncharacterized protein n=1 Tax=Panicum virgatum TaxID=38727 RepID=A0A8T0QJB9_PANVG|nr:hypothetical protein PVAP13_7KG274455 [Panicum virgatum]
MPQSVLVPRPICDENLNWDQLEPIVMEVFHRRFVTFTEPTVKVQSSSSSRSDGSRPALPSMTWAGWFSVGEVLQLSKTWRGWNFWRRNKLSAKKGVCTHMYTWPIFLSLGVILKNTEYYMANFPIQVPCLSMNQVNECLSMNQVQYMSVHESRNSAWHRRAFAHKQARGSAEVMDRSKRSRNAGRAGPRRLDGSKTRLGQDGSDGSTSCRV